MKKLIALSAAALMASSASIAAVSLSGSASIVFADNGASDNTTTGTASLTISGTNGASSASATLDLVAGGMSGAEMTTSIGPVAVSATIDSAGNAAATLSLDVLAGDVTISLDQAGAATITSTVAGVTISHTMKQGSAPAVTTGSATLAGMDVNVSRDGSTTTWDISTTLNGVTLKIDNLGEVTASMGLAGNTVTITNASSTTVTITRDLTSGASLEAGYSTDGNKLTLTASVSF